MPLPYDIFNRTNEYSLTDKKKAILGHFEQHSPGEEMTDLFQTGGPEANQMESQVNTDQNNTKMIRNTDTCPKLTSLESLATNNSNQNSTKACDPAKS